MTRLRLAIFSDVHGNLHALEAVLADARERADGWVVAGDLAWGGPFPAEVIDRVRSLGCPVVLGNTDQTLLEEPAHPYARWARARLEDGHLDYLRGLPLVHWVDPPTPAPGGAAGTGSGRLLVVHSTPDDPARALPDPSQEEGLERLFGQLPAEMVVHGHDHRVSRVRLARTTVVGLGSVGLPLDGDPRAAYALFSWVPGLGWQVEQRRVAYDVEAAGEAARLRGCPGGQRWAEAIRRGISPDRITL